MTAHTSHHLLSTFAEKGSRSDKVMSGEDEAPFGPSHRTAGVSLKKINTNLFVGVSLY